MRIALGFLAYALMAQSGGEREPKLITEGNRLVRIEPPPSDYTGPKPVKHFPENVLRLLSPDKAMLPDLARVEANQATAGDSRPRRVADAETVRGQSEKRHGPRLVRVPADGPLVIEQQ